MCCGQVVLAGSLITMSGADSNPYKPTLIGAEKPEREPLGLPEERQQQLEAVIKEAGQVWLVVMLSFCCGPLSILLVAPWYGIRLQQWIGLATDFPELNDATNRHWQAVQFRSAKIKLLVGLVVGFTAFLMSFSIVVIGSI